MRVRVSDLDDNPVSGANVEIAAFKRQSYKHLEGKLWTHVNLLSEFPYAPLANNAIIASQQTESTGRAVFLKEHISGQPEEFDYFFIAKKQGYLGAFAPATACKDLASRFWGNPEGELPLTLTSLQDYPKVPTDEVLATYYPVKIELGSYAYWSKLEAADRPIILPFVPQVRQDILAEATSVDVTLNVVPKDTWQSFEYLSPHQVAGCNPEYDQYPRICQQLGDFHYQQTLANVAVNQLNKFEFSLPAGLYETYFRFAIHRVGLPTIHYDYYTALGSDKGIYPGSVFDSFRNWALGIEEKPESVVQTYPELREAHNVVFMVLPHEDYKAHDMFIPIYPDQINADENRINIVFLHGELEPVDTKDMIVNFLEDPDLGLEQVEPLKSNRDSFNFWYYPESLTADEMNYPFAFFSDVMGGRKELTRAQKIYLSHGFRGKTIFYGLLGDNTINGVTSAGSGKCSFNKGVIVAIHTDLLGECLEEGSLGECVKEFQISRIFFHELGHELGMLGEEYVSNHQLFDINSYTAAGVSYTGRIDYNPHYRQNTFFPENYDPAVGCLRAEWSSSWGLGAVMCVDNQPQYHDLVPWSDYFGNGCGEDGIVDCELDDPQNHMEVGFFFGGGPAGNLGYANLVKPTRTSIMSDRVDFNSIPAENWDGRIYGLVNERVLCQAIEVYTGLASGICNSHIVSNDTP